MRIYIDMDDTTMHFREHAIAHGVPRWDGSWYTTDPANWTPLQKLTQARTNDLMRNADFWLSMPVVPGAHELISASSFKGDVWLLTALPSAFKGEPDTLDMVRRAKIAVAWQRLHVPPERVIVCERADKVRYAFNHFDGHGNVLIDDAIQTREQWTDANGVALHVPDVAAHGLSDAIDFIKGF